MRPKHDDSDSAFPMLPPDQEAYRGWPADPGMSLRDYFAAHCLMRINVEDWPSDKNEFEAGAEAAYAYADALLKARQAAPATTVGDVE